MATPDLSVLDERYKQEYNTLLLLGFSEEEAFKNVFENQERVRKAQEAERFQREQTEAFEQKDYSKLDPLVQEALGLIMPDYSKPIAERFMPGFFPEVVPLDSDKALPTATQTLEPRDLTPPERLEELRNEALNELEQYFASQGYPTLVETKDNL